jgi:hypothetical protein
MSELNRYLNVFNIFSFFHSFFPIPAIFLCSELHKQAAIMPTWLFFDPEFCTPQS